VYELDAPLVPALPLMPALPVSPLTPELRVLELVPEVDTPADVDGPYCVGLLDMVALFNM
jgi:hypothetical protein